jgi:hypothetical protein
MIARIALLLTLMLVSVVAEAQQFGPAQFPIKDDDGDPISNHALSAGQMKQVAG